MILLFFVGVFGLAASAQTPITVKVDSFSSLGRSTTGAEICGHIEGGTGSLQILIVAAPPSRKAPANTLPPATPASCRMAPQPSF